MGFLLWVASPHITGYDVPVNDLLYYRGASLLLMFAVGFFLTSPWWTSAVGCIGGQVLGAFQACGSLALTLTGAPLLLFVAYHGIYSFVGAALGSLARIYLIRKS